MASKAQARPCPARKSSRLLVSYHGWAVDVIEAGFPAASPDDLKAVQRIAREVGTPDGPTVAGLARALEGDILTAWDGVRDAAETANPYVSRHFTKPFGDASYR